MGLSDWELEQLRIDQLRAAAAAPGTGHRLFKCPAATPTWEHRQALAECLTAARAAGLRLPEIDVVWKQGEPDITDGVARAEDDGRRCTIALTVFNDPWGLRKTIYHELKHAADYLSGSFLDDRAELELRAEDFARQMMSNWFP